MTRYDHPRALAASERPAASAPPAQAATTGIVSLPDDAGRNDAASSAPAPPSAERGAAAEAPTGQAHGGSLEPDDVYTIKWTEFGGGARRVPFLLQNRNGACPLLAICNVLLLRGDISLHEGMEQVSFEHLAALLCEHLMTRQPPTDAEALANYEHNLGDCIASIPKLRTGLDMNVRFIRCAGTGGRAVQRAHARPRRRSLRCGGAASRGLSTPPTASSSICFASVCATDGLWIRRTPCCLRSSAIRRTTSSSREP